MKTTRPAYRSGMFVLFLITLAQLAIAQAPQERWVESDDKEGIVFAHPRGSG